LNNYGELLLKIVHTSYPFSIHLVANLEYFIALPTELTKSCCFYSWQLSRFDIVKNVSTNSVQNSANTARGELF